MIRLLILLLFMFSVVYAEPSDERLRVLENRIAELESNQNSSEENVVELETIVENVERKSFTDMIDFTPEVRLRFDKMRYKVGDFETQHNPSTVSRDEDGIPNRENIDKNFDIASSVRFRLNMHANLLEELQFHGRFVFQHSTQSSERLCILSKEIKSSGSISGIDIDRAYFDYLLNRGSDYPLIFSFGVLPTSGGTPMQFAEVRARQSVFPALVFDMDSYGVIFTSNLSHLFSQETFLRVVIAQAYTLDPNIYPYQCNRETIDNADIYGLYFDTRFSRGSLFSIGVNVLDNLKAHPYLGPDVNAEDSKVLGRVITFGAGLDSENIADSGVTTFIHAALSHGHSNGNEENNSTQGGAVGGFTTSSYADGSLIEDFGYSLYAGLLFDLSKYITFGAEYNYGSKYWFAATQGAEDMYNKLATRGHVGEGYIIWNLNRYLFTKVGYMYTDEEYTGSGWHFGEPIAKGGTQQVGYIQINASF